MLRYHLDNPPTTQQYLLALRELEEEEKLTGPYRQILLLQYLRPGHTISASELSRELNMAVVTVNGYYGRLGHWIADRVNIVPSEREEGGYRWWCVLSSGETENGYFQWEMYSQLAEAIEQFGLLESTVF